MPEKTTDTVSTGKLGRSNLASESISVSAARELLPTPVVTRSGDVSRTETTSTNYHSPRGGRSSAGNPEI